MESIETRSAEEILIAAAEENSTGTDLASGLKEEARDHEDSEVAETLMKTADDIKNVVGGKSTKVFEGNQAGQAYQGVEGSSEIDVTASIEDAEPGKSLVDLEELGDIVKHEEEHEVQAQDWNAESVTVGDKELNHNNVSETGSMSVQQTLKNVSDGYRAIYAEVTSMVSADDAREAARTGDLLGLAKKAGATEEELMAANPDFSLAV